MLLTGSDNPVPLTCGRIRNRASDFKVGFRTPALMATEPHTDDRPLRADARRNRERILAAARVACAEHGPAVQMDDVARRAGVGVGTVYRHFPTKDALIQALVAEKIRVTTENLREALEIEDPWDAFAAGVR